MRCKNKEKLKQYYYLQLFEKQLGRYNKAPRRAYILISKKTNTVKFIIKEIDLNKKKYREEYKKEIFFTKMFSTSKTKYINSWIENNKGYIQSRFFENISWLNIKKNKIEIAMRRASTALNKMHEAGYIHGDIAPKNILVDVEGNIAFIDFEDVEKANKKKIKKDWLYFVGGFSPPQSKRSKHYMSWNNLYKMATKYSLKYT